MRVIVAAGALALLLPVAALHAQLPELQPGTRVRVSAPGVVAGRRLEGTIVARARDTITVTRPSGVPMPIPLGRITRVDVSRGRSRGLGATKGALWGTGSGLALGLLAAVTPDDCGSGGCGSDQPTDPELVLGTTAGGAMLGALIGTFVGAEQWERLPLGRVAGVVWRPHADGFAVGVRFR